MKNSRVSCFLLMMVAVFLFISPAATLAEYQTLRPGQESNEVRSMQNGLLFLGFDIKVDGKYGPMTEQTVRLFQVKNRLEDDGLAGRMTLTKLYDQAPQFKPDSVTVPALPVVESGVPQATPIQSDQTSVTGQAYVHTGNGGSLNLRNRPAYRNTTVAQLPNGTAVEVISRTGSWSLVRAQGRMGYVQSSFLRQGTVHDTPKQTEAPATQPPVESTVPVVTQAPISTLAPEANIVPVQGSSKALVVTGNRGSLNLRERMSISSNAMLQIPYMAQVSVLARLGSWTQVIYLNTTGYVMDSFLQHAATAPDTPVVTPFPSPTANMQMPAPAKNEGIAFVNNQQGRYLNLRSSPRQNNNIIGQIPSGTALLLIAKGADWTEVVFEGKQGFVMTSFLRFDAQTSTQQPTLEPVATETPLPPVVTPDATVEPVTTPATQSEEKDLFTRILRAGSEGEDVLSLQNRLAELKYAVSRTSKYDSMTQEAVKQFQLQNSLKADGIFGSQTAQVLQSSAARTALDKPLSFNTLRIDNNNPAVEAMQKALKDLGFPLSVNSRFDIATHQAVVGFQQRNGLPITGIADALSQAAMFSGNANGYSTSVSGISASEGKGGGPSSSQVKLLHWFKDIKPRFSAGQTITVYHPSSDTSFNIRFYSMGNHADSEPSTWKDTQLMNRAFGTPSWNINTVYVKLPDGTWTLAAMHNRPHLTGAISGNGFGGHLCIHFLRDMDEVNRNDPDYGASNQRAIRKAWQNMTGEVIE